MTNTTICITSSGRFDLLERTLKSLARYWDGPPTLILINDDSAIIPPEQYRFILGQLSDWAYPLQVDLSNILGGQIKSIDHLYSKVNTPYIFHCEDDWEFYKSGFYAASLDVLESNPIISNVWIREPNDRNRHPVTGGRSKTKGGTQYQFMSQFFNAGLWPGFSFNPGLRRLSDYKRIFPNGYSGATEFNPNIAWKSESKIAIAYKKAGMKAATLLTGYVKHIGTGRHVQ